MSETSSAVAVGRELSTSSPGTTNVAPAPSGNGRGQPRHVLPFEQPLAKLEEQIQELEALQASKGLDYTKELRQLRVQYTSMLRKIYDKLSAWETVQLARHPQRPQFKDYVDLVCR